MGFRSAKWSKTPMHTSYATLTDESKRYRKKAKRSDDLSQEARREQNKSKAMAGERGGRNRGRRIGRRRAGLRTSSVAARGGENEAGTRRLPTEEHVARSGNEDFARTLSRD